MTKRVPPDELFENQSPVGALGYCTTGGWVVKRSIFSRTGLFDAHLRLHQDTVMFIKFAAMGKMLPGRLDEPVAMRRVHATNRSSVVRPAASVYVARVRMWATLWRWGKHALSESRRNLLLERFLAYASAPYRDADTFFGQRLLPWLQLTGLGVLYPDLAFKREFWLRYRRAMLPLALRKAASSIKARLWDAQ